MAVCTFSMLLLFVTLIKCQEYLKLNETMQRHILQTGRNLFGVDENGRVKKQPSSPRMPDPAETFAMLKHTDRMNAKKNSDEEEKIKIKWKKNKIGRIGPPGPPGPVGNPGARVSVPSIMSELRKVLRTQTLQAKSRSGRFTSTLGGMMAVGMPDVLVGFAATTQASIQLMRRTDTELNNFEVSKAGCFQRGNQMNLSTGQFTAPVTAVYSFHAAIHFAVPRGAKDLARKDFLTVHVCVDGHCRKGSGISSTTGIGTNSRIFTVNLDGYVYLQASQYVSVNVHNNSHKHVITAMKGSYFTGMLVGT